MPIDFIAQDVHFLEHLAPIWWALDSGDRGTFYITENIRAFAAWRGLFPTTVFSFDKHDYIDIPDDENPIVMSAYRILDRLVATESVRHHIPRFKIFTEHGVGFSFSDQNSSYSGGTGERRHVNLFLAPNDYVAKRNLAVYPTIPNEIIGVPKMDKWDKHPFPRHDPPVICISFHWDCQVSPETTSAWLFYKNGLAELAKKYKMTGHGHPRVIKSLIPEYQRMGIEPVLDFEEVMERADIYINDSSSTLYEFAYTGKPVIVMNSPKYRRKVHHGLRFWDHADVGINVSGPDQLDQAIQDTLNNRNMHQVMLQEQAVNAVFPVRGIAAYTAAQAIMKYTKTNKRSVNRISDNRIGIIYMAFGDPAAREVRRSVSTMRRLGIDIPVTVVGTARVPGTNFIEWPGESPFLRTARNNFKFRAGRIKPRLFDLTPYDWTMYLDADTEFISADFVDGFSHLEHHDVVVTQETLLLKQLYHKNNAGWELNIQERDATIAEIGGGDVPFWNTGVMFFNKTIAAGKLFSEWYMQWLRFQQWDEQLAFMRAAYLIPELRVCKLGVEWNAPHRELAKYIYHWYGKGTARSN